MADNPNEEWEIWANATDSIQGQPVQKRKWLVETGKGSKRGTSRLNYHKAAKEKGSVKYSIKRKK